MSIGVLMFAASLLTEAVGGFVDERRLQVRLTPESSVHASSGLYFFCNRKKLFVGVATGASRDGASPVVLKWSFDDEAMRQQTVFRARDALGIYIPAWWEFLEQALDAERLAVQVADADVMRFDLGDARSDLEEFTWQCRA